MSEAPQKRFFQAPDGLILHVLAFGEMNGRTPIVCIPGLTRPARDFSALARYLREESDRPVFCLDYRGRGGSDWDKDWSNYSIPVEMGDILAVLDQIGVKSAIFIGTSRGGLHAMNFAALRPELVKALVVNDIGPVLNPQGLARIKDYVGRLPLLRDFDAAVAHFKCAMAAQFTALSEADWLFYAQNTLVATPERLRFSYDPQLARVLEGFDPNQPLPDPWPHFCAIKAPMLALRAENSDLLTPETLAEMAARHPLCQTHVVPGQGHAPLLTDAPTLRRVRDFIAEADRE